MPSANGSSPLDTDSYAPVVAAPATIAAAPANIARPPNWRIIATSESAKIPAIGTVMALSTAGMVAPDSE